MTRDRDTNGADDSLDRQLDEVLGDLRQSYNTPPAVPPLEAMWTNIERSLDEQKVVPLPRIGAPLPARPTRIPIQWLGLAAALIIGVAIGRASASSTVSSPPIATAPTPTAPKGGGGTLTRPSGPERTPQPEERRVVARPEERAASPLVASASRPIPPSASADGDGIAHEFTGGPDRYLVQATALLIGLTSDAPRPGEDVRLALRAGELLTTTRLMLDAPTTDTKTRELLLDLELVLTQVVRLQSESGRQELRLIREALEQRELLPRLHTAVASGTGD